MKVLLLQFVKNVGRAGEIKDVADGLALNQLIPQKLAVPATKDVIAQHAAKNKQAAEKQAAVIEAFRLNIAKIKGQKLVYSVQTNEKGKLYQAITPALVRTFLREQFGAIFGEHAVQMKPIRDIGAHPFVIVDHGIKEQFVLHVSRQ